MAVTPIFLDANVPIYSAGRPHELKESCGQVLLMAARRPELFWTDAEVLRELLHRYRTSSSWADGRARIENLTTLMSRGIEPLRDEDVLHATSLADRYSRLSARDLVHLAVMTRLGSAAVVSTDGDFDVVSGVRRLDPATLSSWRHELD